MIIPFDGPYWYFSASGRWPGPKAHLAHGKRADVNVRSTDWIRPFQKVWVQKPVVDHSQIGRLEACRAHMGNIERIFQRNTRLSYRPLVEQPPDQCHAMVSSIGYYGSVGRHLEWIANSN